MEEMIHLGTITSVSSVKEAKNVTQTPLFATAKEVSDTKDFFEKKYKDLIDEKISDPQGRDLLLKVLYACLPLMATHQLFLKKNDEHRKKREKEEWDKFEDWEKGREEECYGRFLKEFRLSEKRFKERIGDKNFEMWKSFKKNKFFTQLYYEPVFSGGRGLTKEDPIIVNPSDKEVIINNRPPFLYGLLFEFFWKTVEIKAKAFIGRYNLNPIDWEDMRQEVFIKFEKGKKLFDPERAEIWTYLSKIADNAIINFVKKNSRENVELNEAITKGDDSIERNIENSINKDSLSFALNQLNREEKEVIESMFFSGLSQADIAKRIKKSQPTISRIFDRAIQQLKSNNVLKRTYRE